MRRILLVLTLVSTVGAIAAAEQKAKPSAVKAPPLPPSTEDLLVADPAHAAWAPSDKVGLPKGAQVALIGTDPVSTGTTTYLKTPAGYKIPNHWHTHTEYFAFVSGSGTLILDGKTHALGPGSYVVIPGRTSHEFSCAAGAECLVIGRRSGPADMNWGNPAR